MTDLNHIKYYLLDMDGTIYLGNEMIDGALEFLDLLQQMDRDYIFLTNNSSKNRYAYQKRLKEFGCDVEPDKIFTSGEATTLYLKGEAPEAKVFLLGTEYLEEEFEQSGFELVKNKDLKPDYVVVGFDTTLTYERLWEACDYIREGIPYIATHPDYNCPLEGGKFMPDAGAIIDFIAASTNRRPHVIGKPNKDIIEMICNKYGYEKSEIAMVGDRLYTDIKTGNNAGITSILVLSGETALADYEQSDVIANYIFPSVKELSDTLQGII